MKKNFRLTALIAIIMIGLLYSCKKEKNDHIKPTLKEVSLSPEEYGYSKISKSELTKIKGADLSQVFKNFTVYYNKQTNSIYASNNSSSAIAGQEYVFHSYSCISSGTLTNMQPPNNLILDDSGQNEKFPDQGIVDIYYCRDILLYGSSHGLHSNQIGDWVSADEGYFNIDQTRTDPQDFRSLVQSSPEQWIKVQYL